MQNREELVHSIRRVRHFSHLSLNDLRTIVTSGQVKNIPGGSTLFQEGELCAGMFVLIKGQVHLCKLGPQGQVNIVGIIQPVIMFNEVAVLDGGTNPVTAIANENCLVWQISHTVFQNLLDKYPQVGLSLLKVLARRNREMITRYEDLSFRPVVARTSKLLLDLSHAGTKTIDRRDCSIGQMAAMVASVPEAISRSLNVIKSSGAIKVSRAEITVMSTDKLSEMAQIVQQTGEE
jgi:CRP-like cAMP-binding protein